MTDHTPPARYSYTAAIVTFRRPELLATVLQGLSGQTVTPSLTVIADNDPDESARQVVEAFRERWIGELLYVPVGENLGPAGGWAHAMSAARSRPGQRGEWVLVVDDDDPIEAPSLVEGLLSEALTEGGRLAGIGLRGAHWDARWARLKRHEIPEGSIAEVDYLAGGGAPMYSWQAIEAVGFFKADLFFGFEDLDLGFRLRQAGWRLLAAPRPSVHEVADTAGVRTPWREYYKTRALLWILNEHVGHYSVLVTLVRSVVLGSLRLWALEKQPALSRARLLGAWDGLRGNLGARRYIPVVNPPKSGQRPIVA